MLSHNTNNCIRNNSTSSDTPQLAAAKFILTVYSVSKKLSGIIFLEDHSITSYDEFNEIYSAYVYLNPNADNSVAKAAFNHYLLSLPRIEYDDFEFDNY